MFRSKSMFEKVLDKATSNLLLEPDLDSMLQLCDMIRGGDVKPREACALLKSRVIEEKNPHVQFFAVSVLDTVMKNCGENVHTEVITESYMESLKEVVKNTKSDNVKNKLLEMIQSWAIGFKDKPNLKVASNLYNIMKAEGYKFPTVTDTTGMFKSEKAPTWSDGDECSKCKTEFGLVQRKHHCRACGNIFCNKCSSKQAIIPKYGIEKEVRVCDTCYGDLVKKTPKAPTAAESNNELPAEYLNSALAKESQEPPKRDELALKEEEELQLALALSLDEQENKHKIRKEQVATDYVYSTVNKTPTTSTAAASSTPAVDPETDPDLARYLNRSYWDSKKSEQESQVTKSRSSPTPEKSRSSPTPKTESASDAVTEPPKVEETLQNGEVSIDMELVANLRTSVEIFVNRMRSDEIRGRSIANDSTVQSLFQSITNMHPTLIQYMNELEEKRLHQEALQDKLVQIRDARAALDALRAEHAEKLRRAAEEANRLRQIQMAQKLEVMRQKKQEYLAYQRQLALQRMQEQEAARHARLEQQKQLIQQKAMQPSMLVAGYNTQYPPPQSNVVNDVPADPSQQSGYYGGYPPTNQTYLPQNVQYPSGPPSSAMYAQPGSYNEVAYQQQSAVNGQNGMPMQQMQPGMESYSMAEMNANLPAAQSSSMTSLGPQVVASAPPPTPQPSLNSQQMMTGNVDPSMAGYQAPQQGYYVQPGPPQGQPQENQEVVGQNQGLLISFD